MVYARRAYLAIWPTLLIIVAYLANLKRDQQSVNNAREPRPLDELTPHLSHICPVLTDSLVIFLTSLAD